MSFMDNAQEIAPAVFVFDNFLEDYKDVLNAALDIVEETGVRRAEVVGEDIAEQKVAEEIRNTFMIELSPTFENDVRWWMISQKLWKAGDEYAKHHNIYFSYMEAPQFLIYPQNQGFYKPHADSSKSYPRIFSSVLYLNTVEQGGETYFDKFDIAVKPVAGRMIMFPANFAYTHGAKVPESGEKYAIVSWFAP